MVWGKKCKSYISSKSEPDHAHGNYGSVWIQLIFAENWKLKIENWKYCNKIIFKCVNNTVKSFLMKKLLKSEVCGSREQCTEPIGVHSTAYFAVNSARVDEKWTVNRLKSQKQGQEEKKKKRKKKRKNANARIISCIQTLIICQQRAFVDLIVLKVQMLAWQLIKRDFASSIYSSLVWWMTFISCMRENTK